MAGIILDESVGAGGPYLGLQPSARPPRPPASATPPAACRSERSIPATRRRLDSPASYRTGRDVEVQAASSCYLPASNDFAPLPEDQRHKSRSLKLSKRATIRPWGAYCEGVAGDRHRRKRHSGPLPRTFSDLLGRYRRLAKARNDVVRLDSTSGGRPGGREPSAGGPRRPLSNIAMTSRTFNIWPSRSIPRNRQRYRRSRSRQQTIRASIHHTGEDVRQTAQHVSLTKPTARAS